MTVLGQQLISIVRAKAADNPNLVYQSPFQGEESYGACVYIHNGCASCIIGHALLEAGVIDVSFEFDDLNHYPVRGIIDALDLMIDSEERMWLRDVQNYQDLTETWGGSVILADRNALERIMQQGVSV